MTENNSRLTGTSLNVNLPAIVGHLLNSIIVLHLIIWISTRVVRNLFRQNK